MVISDSVLKNEFAFPNIYINVCRCVCKYVRTYMCVYVHIVCVCMCIYCVRVLCKRVCVCVCCACMCIFTCVYMCACSDCICKLVTSFSPYLIFNQTFTVPRLTRLIITHKISKEKLVVSRSQGVHQVACQLNMFIFIFHVISGARWHRLKAAGGKSSTFGSIFCLV